MHLRSPLLKWKELPSGEAAKCKPEPHRINRRLFAQSLVGLIAAPLSAKQPVAADGFGEKPEDLSGAEWGEVKARHNNLLRVYGERLNTEQRHTLLNVLIGNERMLASIRQFAARNSDPAALTLRLIAQETVL